MYIEEPKFPMEIPGKGALVADDTEVTELSDGTRLKMSKADHLVRQMAHCVHPSVLWDIMMHYHKDFMRHQLEVTPSILREDLVCKHCGSDAFEREECVPT